MNTAYTQNHVTNFKKWNETEIKLKLKKKKNCYSESSYDIDTEHWDKDVYNKMNKKIYFWERVISSFIRN